MGRVADEAEAELQQVLARHAQRPRDAVLALLLMALEREEIVSLAYRKGRIAARLARMGLPPEVRRLIEHAVIWLWLDEEMHAVYARAALLRLGRGSTRVVAYASQLGGAVAGWATSVIHHARWYQAPIARSAAGLVTLAGHIAGKVPHEVGRQLKFSTFRDFCLFNAELEQASARCWDVLADLGEQVPELPPAALTAFRRVVDDEDHHRRVFEVLAAALTDDDRLVEGVHAAELAGQIGNVSRHYLPRDDRGLDNQFQPLGSGGTVWCQQAATGDDAIVSFRALLASCGLAEVVARAHEGAGGPPSVIVKTSFMLGVDRQDPSPIVSPALAAELAQFLRQHGCGDIMLAEVPNVYDHFFRGRSVAEVAGYWGFTDPAYRVVDLTDDLERHPFGRGIGPSHVARCWRQADLRLSLGKLRSHPVDQALLSLGNLEGMTGRVNDFVFQERWADRPTALMMLLEDFPCHFALLDAFDHCPDCLAGMMGSHHPRQPRRFYAGADALAVDRVVMRHLNTDPQQSPLLAAACHWFGGWPEPTLIGEDRAIRPWRGPQATDTSALLSLLALPVYTWGSGRGSLFLPKTDRAAFPPSDRPSAAVRWGRATIRRLLGLPR